MASYFEEQGLFDRPFVDVNLTIRGKTIPAKARVASGKESDMMDVFFASEHSRVLASLDQSTNGLPSERASIRAMYSTRPRSDIIDQLLGTRGKDIIERAIKIAGLDLVEEDKKMSGMGKEERTNYEAEKQAILDEARIKAKAEIASDYDSTSTDELLDKVTEVNVNIKALARANRALYAYYLYYTLYRPDEQTRCFESADQVKNELSSETIDSLTLQVRKALEQLSKVPTESPEASEQSGPTPSQSNSVEDTTASGEPTTTASDDSKQSIS